MHLLHGSIAEFWYCATAALASSSSQQRNTVALTDQAQKARQINEWD